MKTQPKLIFKYSITIPGERDVIRMFLSSNVDVNHAGGGGNTALHVSANHGKYLKFDYCDSSIVSKQKPTQINRVKRLFLMLKMIQVMKYWQVG